jgi:predicted DNA-binding WGR domain protein
MAEADNVPKPSLSLITDLNRPGSNDSGKSLDAAASVRNNQRTCSSHFEWSRMHDLNLASASADRSRRHEPRATELTRGLRLERIEPERNMARYYTLAVELTLFEDWSCTRSFGRIGARGGRIMLGLFEDRASAEVELIALLRAKQARGYRVITP